MNHSWRNVSGIPLVHLMETRHAYTSIELGTGFLRKYLNEFKKKMSSVLATLQVKETIVLSDDRYNDP